MVIGGILLAAIFFLIGHVLIRRWGYVLLGQFVDALGGLALMGTSIGPPLLHFSTKAVNGVVNGVLTFFHSL